MALTGRTALLAALGLLPVGILAPSWTGMLAVNAPLSLVILCDYAMAAPVRTLRFTRSGDTSVRLGDGVDVQLTVTNPSRRRLRALIRDAWAPSAAQDPVRQKLSVPAGERRRVTTVLRPTRRGDRRAEHVTVRSHGPLGLAARQGRHEVSWAVRVLPPFTSRKHLPSRLARLRELDGRTSVLTRGEGTEFDSLREYVPGDDTRSIDWRATARQSTVAVRTWRPERDRHLLIVLDTGRTSAGRVGDVPRLDAAMDAALLLTALASRAGDRVDLIAYDRRLRAQVQGRSAREVLPAVVDALATLEPSLVETDARGLAATALARAPRRSLVVLLTGLDAAPVEEGLLPVLPRLTQRHTVLVASPADPHIARMAASRGTVEGVYEAAAATQSQAQRLRTAEQLQRHGVTVVDAVPDALAPALADAYLALKAAGRL
ncbi:lipoprotein [Streptomyces laurentii]|uniref:Lipoprotein n=1 Tax=Streptomyces laurentii TaxID=39478 RepID=A0A169NGK2_STRLU|nr:lipoprotein [Streptomyces laurentii]